MMGSIYSVYAQDKPQKCRKPEENAKNDRKGGVRRGIEDAGASTPHWTNILIAGTSGMIATSVLHPADVLKTRLQLIGNFKRECQKVTMVRVARHLIKNEGYAGLYRGLSAALLRQFVYFSGRLVGFNVVYSYHKCVYNTPLDFSKQVAMGCFAGGVGALLSTPAEVCLVRMMADGRLQKTDRRNYRNVCSAMIRIANEEGCCTLWRGATSTVLRAVLVNGAQLTTYATAKECLEPCFGDTLALFITASMMSGLVATVVSMPVDIVKTRVQDAPQFMGQLNTLKRVIICESYSALWKGFVPAFFKIAPHTIITFLALEQFNHFYNCIVK